MSTHLIRSIKKHISRDDFNIIESPLRSSKMFVESIKDSDYLLIIADPTLFGINDLISNVGIAREIYVPFGVLLNRSEINDDNKVIDYCRSENIHILSSIPDSVGFAMKYYAMDFANSYYKSFEHFIENIIYHTYIGGKAFCSQL